MLPVAAAAPRVPGLGRAARGPAARLAGPPHSLPLLLGLRLRPVRGGVPGPGAVSQPGRFLQTETAAGVQTRGHGLQYGELLQQVHRLVRVSE